MPAQSRPSQRDAIDAMCKSCVYDPSPYVRGAWRQQVADCGGVTCPLYSVRPVPRHCASNGVIDEALVAIERAKLHTVGTA